MASKMEPQHISDSMTINDIAEQQLRLFRQLHLEYKFPYKGFNPEVAEQSLSFSEYYAKQLKDIFGDMFVGLGLFGGRANGLSNQGSDMEHVVFFRGIKMEYREELHYTLGQHHAHVSNIFNVPEDGGVEFVHPPLGVFTRYFDSDIVYGDERQIKELSIQTLGMMLESYRKVWPDIISSRHETLARYKPIRMVERIQQIADSQAITYTRPELHALYPEIEQHLEETKRQKLEIFRMEHTPERHMERLQKLYDGSE